MVAQAGINLVCAMAGILALLTGVGAQSGMPECGATCAATAATAVGCAGPQDLACVCKSQPFLSAVQQCTALACNAADRQSADQILANECGTATSGTSTSTSSTTNSSTSTGSTTSGSGTTSHSTSSTSSISKSTSTSTTSSSTSTSTTTTPTSTTSTSTPSPTLTGTTLTIPPGGGGISTPSLGSTTTITSTFPDVAPPSDSANAAPRLTVRSTDSGGLGAFSALVFSGMALVAGALAVL